MKASLKGLMVLALCCVVFSAGCTGRGKKTGLPGDDGVIGIGERGAMDGERLGERPGELDIILAVEFDNVLFEYDRAQIGPSEREKIENVADYMRSNPSVGVIIEGHCDERGSREYNMALGERRALAVRAYMVGLGIAGDSIQTVSFGKEKPALLGHDPESWIANRRAEFVLIRL